MTGTLQVSWGYAFALIHDSDDARSALMVVVLLDPFEPRNPNASPALLGNSERFRNPSRIPIAACAPPDARRCNTRT